MISYRELLNGRCVLKAKNLPPVGGRCSQPAGDGRSQTSAERDARAGRRNKITARSSRTAEQSQSRRFLHNEVRIWCASRGIPVRASLGEERLPGGSSIVSRAHRGPGLRCPESQNFRVLSNPLNTVLGHLPQHSNATSTGKIVNAGSVHAVHLNPKYCPEPQKYDLGWWLRLGPAPNATYPFFGWGASLRPCAGMKLAKSEMKLISVVMFLTRCE